MSGSANLTPCPTTESCRLANLTLMTMIHLKTKAKTEVLTLASRTTSLAWSQYHVHGKQRVNKVVNKRTTTNCWCPSCSDCRETSPSSPLSPATDRRRTYQHNDPKYNRNAILNGTTNLTSNRSSKLPNCLLHCFNLCRVFLNTGHSSATFHLDVAVPLTMNTTNKSLTPILGIGDALLEAGLPAVCCGIRHIITECSSWCMQQHVQVSGEIKPKSVGWTALITETQTVASTS